MSAAVVPSVCHGRRALEVVNCLFDGLVALSSVYRASWMLGDYRDDEVYFSAPLPYLPALGDEWRLERYRRSRIVFCVDQPAASAASSRSPRSPTDPFATILDGMLRS